MKSNQKIDWLITLCPLGLVVIFCGLFCWKPEESNDVLSHIRFVLGDTFGLFYLAVGLGIFLLSLYLAFSDYGRIVLGEPNDSPQYSFFSWGAMMFTAGLAADILFYSFSEWILYVNDPHLAELGQPQDWAGVFPLFHWSLIPWGFYLVLAVAFGFMLHVRKRTRQRYSEACRPILGRWTDRIPGRLIDLLAVFALLAGTATTFSLATPLMVKVLEALFHIHLPETGMTILILLLTCCIYTSCLLKGLQGVSWLARMCVYLFFFLLMYVLVLGGEMRYILETGVSSLGRMVQQFFELSTFTDPLRSSSFPQNWTIFYWAYWMVWCVASPFFIGRISRGRTVRQTILGGYLFGAGSTIASFIILGNYGMGLQFMERADFLAHYQANGNLYDVIISIIETLPASHFFLLLLLVTMIAFYATSFDSIAYIGASYSCHRLGQDEMPHKLLELMWCILLILLPIALVFSESSMANLQSVSIIAAFPVGFVIILIAASFLKDARPVIR